MVRCALLMLSISFWISAQAQVEPLSRLSGIWVDGDSQSKFVETWKRIGYNNYVGNSYLIQGLDTVYSATLQIYQEGEQLVYTSRTSGSKATRLISETSALSKGPYKFKNQRHEITTLVVYEFDGPNKLKVSRKGTDNGHIKTIKIDFVKIKTHP